MKPKERWPNIPTKLSPSWRMGAGTIKLAGALVTKAFLKTAQRVQTKNLDILMKVVHQRPQGQPLVTVSNHASCLDDPVIWGVLPFSTHSSTKKMRWTPAASEFIFTNRLYSWFFSRNQLVPITRGLGVYQRGLDYCINLLNEGKWVHIFPEGKINMTLNQMRLKWGVGRLLAEAVTIPTVVPIWHIGMDDILPNKSPYIPRLFKKLTIVVGDPIDFSPLFRTHQQKWGEGQCGDGARRIGGKPLEVESLPRGNAVMLRRQITDVVQQKLYELRHQAETLHKEWTEGTPISHRAL